MMIREQNIGYRPQSPWRIRLMRTYMMGMNTPQYCKNYVIPNWVTGMSMAFFFVALFACWALFNHVPDFDLVLLAGISTILFFYGSSTLSRSTKNFSSKNFIKRIFIVGLVVRLMWILYMYFIFNPNHYGTTYGDGADVTWYMPFGTDIAKWLAGESKYNFADVIKVNDSAIDDMGYPIWLGVIYFLTGTSSTVFIPFLVKCIVGAYCSISIYHIARRHFGEGTARIAALFICLNPNMIYWCGNMMKEAEMVFLCCLSVDNFDRVLSSGQKYTFRNLLPGMLSAIALFFFRSVLGIVIFLAVFAHIVMASNRVMSLGKKIIAGILVLAMLFVAMGDRIISQSEELFETAQSSEKREQNIEYRSTQEGGNTFAKYAGAAVFAPLIFTIPFPTFNVAHEGQITQVQLSGGNYIKNILSFFVLLVFILMLISGEWRRHVFILAYTVGYHLVLTMSNFAHSGRFHMPVWPMVILFAAYGIQIAKTNGKLRKWFPIVLVAEVAVCLVWNWFKLKGRGMI